MIEHFVFNFLMVMTQTKIGRLFWPISADLLAKWLIKKTYCISSVLSTLLCITKYFSIADLNILNLPCLNAKVLHVATKQRLVH